MSAVIDMFIILRFVMISIKNIQLYFLNVPSCMPIILQYMALYTYIHIHPHKYV